MFNVDTLLGQHLPRLATQPLIRPLLRQGLSWLLNEEAFAEFAKRHPHLRGLDFVEQALGALDFDYRVSEAELENIPASGRVIIVANHPIGSLDGLALDTDMRWEFIISLAAGGRAGASVIDAALALDNTQNGQLAAATAHAAIPTAEGKAGTWASVVELGEGANAVQRAAIDGFTKVWDTALLEPYVAKYFGAIRQVWESKSYETASTIITGLYPVQLVKQSTLDATDAFLAELGEDVPALRRLLVESRDTVVRALKAQAADA